MKVLNMQQLCSFAQDAQKIEDKFLERSDLNLLVQGMSIELWQNLTMFLALSGLRFGEAAALLRSDLDFPGREIHPDQDGYPLPPAPPGTDPQTALMQV